MNNVKHLIDWKFWCDEDIRHVRHDPYLAPVQQPPQPRPQQLWRPRQLPLSEPQLLSLAYGVGDCAALLLLPALCCLYQLSDIQLSAAKPGRLPVG